MRAGSSIERKRTATSTMQCIYSSVSKASLQKTGVLLNSAGDFREFSPKKFENGATGDFQQLEKPAIGGPFLEIWGWKLLQLQAEHPGYAPVAGFRLFSDAVQKRLGLLCLKEQTSLAGPLTSALCLPIATKRSTASSSCHASLRRGSAITMTRGGPRR